MMRRRILYIFLYVFLAFQSGAFAQENSPWPILERSYLNHLYKEEDSYSKKCFVEIIFDQQGRLYLIPCGVEILVNSIGLFRFDGYSYQPIEVFTSEGSAMEGPWVKSMDASGRFLGTNGNKKLFLMDADTQESFYVNPVDSSNNDLSVLGLSSKTDTTFVLGRLPNQEAILFKLKGEKLEKVASLALQEPKEMPVDYNMFVEPTSIWLSPFILPIYRYNRHDRTLISYDEQDFIGTSMDSISTPPGNSRFLPKLLVSPAGNTYLLFSAVYGNRIFQLDQEEDKFVSIQNQFLSGWIPVGIFQDNIGNISFLFQDSNGQYKAVLETVDGQRYDYSAVVTEQEQIKMLVSQDFRESCFLVTSKGLFSAGIQDRNVIKQEMSDLWVSSIADLPDGRILVNTVNDAWFILDETKGELAPFLGPDCGTIRPAFGKGMKQQIIPDKEGNLWFVTQDYLVKYNPTTNECESFDFKMRGTLFALAQARLAVYQYHRQKISFMDIQTQQRVDFGPGIQEEFNGFIRDIHVDVNNIIWIPTNNGLWKLDIDQGKSELLGIDQGFADFRFTTIFEDQEGRLWLGTYFGGLHIYDPRSGAINIIDQSKGLSNNTVMSIIADDDGDMWIGTEYGINLVSKQGEVLKNIYEEDGLSSEVFERFDPFKSKNGQLYFGTRDGLSIIDPTAFKATLQRDTSLQIFLTELTYFDQKKGKEVVQKMNFQSLKSLKIAPDRPYINLKFGLSSYQEIQNNRYAYLLEGKDEDWHYLGSQPELNISRLPPGKYHLLIKGADFRNNWTSSPIAIDIHARDFFYRQPWFYFLIALPFVAFALIWARNKQQEARRLENEVALRTKKILEDKALIEQQAKELRQLDTMKSRFFTNISHELRTPITLIKAPLENLLQKHGTTIEEKIRSSIKMVLNNAGKLGRLVEELLELSSLEVKKASLKETSTPVGKFCRQLFGAYESGAVLKNIDYQFHSELSDDEYFLIDRKRLEKIINNLLSNALKFTPKSGKIQLEVRQEAGQIFIEVRDNGRGIPTEDLPYLFDRYFQTRREDIATEGGTGIGLALSKELAQLMQGDLTVKSEWGEGTLFILQFPAKASTPQNEDAAVPLLAGIPAVELASNKAIDSIINPEQEHKILIVEDNLDMQALIHSILGDQYNCIIANNGAEAWSWLQEKKQGIEDIELILSDVMMPEMDGYSLLEKIKENQQWQNLPVVMLTARSAEEDKLHALRMGVDDYLLKPFSPSELKARIKNLIANYQVRKQVSSNGADVTEKLHIKFDSNLASANQTWLKEVEDAAKEAIQKQIKLSTAFLAEKVFLSERQFSRKLKKITGLTPNEYIQEAKLQKARQLLESQAYTTVNEIAHTCGYSTGSYLSKVYVERFGKKPSDYLA